MSVRRLLLRDTTTTTTSYSTSASQPLLFGFPPSLPPLPSATPATASSLVTAPHYFFIPSLPVSDSFYDLITAPLIACLLLLSLVSLSFVIYLRLRSRFLHHLQHFTTLWTVRSLLVFFASLWLLNETLRLTFFRQDYIFSSLFTTSSSSSSSSLLTQDQQGNLCKLHIVLSLGFFEPGFLITLLFLVTVSIRKTFPSRMWALASICMGCSPVFTFQILFVFFTPLKQRLPAFMHTSYVTYHDSDGTRTVLCKYPLLSTAIFGAFTIGYLLVFLISCYKVVEYVINKNLQSRINMLASTVMIMLPLQVLCIAMSSFWSAGSMVSGGLVLAAFMCVACCIIVGQLVLIIKPISEALAVVGGDHSASSCTRQRPQPR